MLQNSGFSSPGPSPMERCWCIHCTKLWQRPRDRRRPEEWLQGQMCFLYGSWVTMRSCRNLFAMCGPSEWFFEVEAAQGGIILMCFWPNGSVVESSMEFDIALFESDKGHEGTGGDREVLWKPDRQELSSDSVIHWSVHVGPLIILQCSYRAVLSAVVAEVGKIFVNLHAQSPQPILDNFERIATPSVLLLAQFSQSLLFSILFGNRTWKNMNSKALRSTQFDACQTCPSTLIQRLWTRCRGYLFLSAVGLGIASLSDVNEAKVNSEISTRCNTLQHGLFQCFFILFYFIENSSNFLTCGEMNDCRQQLWC